MRLSTKDLPIPYRPNVANRQAQQATPFKELPPILRPRMNFPIPPCMHFGLVIPSEALLDVAIKEKGYEVPGILQSEILPDSPDYDDYTVSRLAMEFIAEHFVHDVKLAYAFVYDDEELVQIVSISSNWRPSEMAEETAKKLAEYFKVTEPPMWYLDSDRWRWRFDV
ncbi:unnamed protein product [Somion occarium]|uniref:Uncharacterized protein n=1 Tax=Somion occarium TaxID=3059160 RepID=A0ABP1D8C8_9APHY